MGGGSLDNKVRASLACRPPSKEAGVLAWWCVQAEGSGDAPRGRTAIGSCEASQNVVGSLNFTF